MSTRDKYKRARNDRDQSAPMQDNEIRVSANRGVAPYIRYALGILTRDNKDTVIIQSSGGAIPIGCLVAEIVRRRVPDLHQLNQISSTDIEDVYFPLEEGLDKVIIKKTMAVLRITLTKNGESLKKNDAGYQAPLPASEVRGLEPRGGEGGEYEGEGEGRQRRGPRRGGDREGGRGGRRGGRGGRGQGQRREGGQRRDRDDDREGGERQGGGYRSGGGQRREGGGGQRRERDDDYRGGNREGGERQGGGYRSGAGYRGGNREGGERQGGYRGDGERQGGYRTERDGGERRGGYRGEGGNGGQRREGAPSGRRVTRGGGQGGQGSNTGRYQGPSN